MEALYGTVGASQLPLIDLFAVDKLCFRVALYAVAAWLILITYMYAIFAEKREFLMPTEQAAAGFGAAVLTTSLVMRTVNSCTQPRRRSSRPHSTSGVTFSMNIVNLIAATTNWIMYFFKVPIVVDQITGCRVHLLRCCEWTVLAFLMTFVVESIDTRDSSLPFWMAATQCLSTAGLLVLPFISTRLVWATTMAFSFFLFSAILIRFRTKYSADSATKQSQHKALHDRPPPSLEEVESLERLEIAKWLLGICCVCWSLFVVNYGFAAGFAFALRFAGRDSLSSCWPFIWDVCVDVAAKMLYASVIFEANESLFDPLVRTERRLAELRSLVTLVWQSSSDALGTSSRVSQTATSCVVSATVSPTIMKLGELPATQREEEGRNFEHAAETLENIYDDEVLQVKRISYIDHEVGDKARNMENREGDEHCWEIGFADLVRRMWAVCDGEIPEDAPFPHIEDGHSTDDEQDDARVMTLNHQFRSLRSGELVHCEAKISRQSRWRVVFVVRDVTDRVLHHQAEKRLVEESANVNRFIRHEVKNGLLEGIALCDDLSEMSKLEQCLPAPNSEENQTIEAQFADLSLILNGTLNTVLSETMARDLTQSVYIPKPEWVDLKTLLTSLSKHIVLEFAPAAFPSLFVDPHLIYCIYRNAVSNAAKYGEKNGEINVLVESDEPTSTLTIRVVNQPGAESGVLLAHTQDFVEAAVFERGTRIHSASPASAALSSGNGGWIMQKVASALGGVIGIVFSEDKTVLTLIVSSVQSCNQALPSGDDTATADEFLLPPGVWGVAVEDSGIQRKLLAKLFAGMGIQADHTIITGATTEECKSFATKTEAIIRAHPVEHFLVIADENLDVFCENGIDRVSISGSLELEKLLSNLKVDSSVSGSVEASSASNAGSHVLALVRSANDSYEDLTLYHDRAHGFLPKVPVQVMKASEMLAPLWVTRFGEAHPKPTQTPRAAKFLRTSA
mmetsp:Transcript_42236/g.95511  ORF Transcript_42236/g.95511 Transcript_42236/m.95511 type:complete len:964 (-) Transcript_42236:192-3083(-)